MNRTNKLLKRLFIALRDRPVWLRIPAFLLILGLLWLPWLGLGQVAIADGNTRSIVTLIGLYVIFLLLLPRWGASQSGWQHPFRHYGLEWNSRWRRSWLFGFGLGSLAVLILYGLQWAAGWQQWQGWPPAIGRFFLEGLLMAIAIGFAEELLFRGWLLQELQRDFPRQGGWMSAFIFAAVHRFGLQILGLTLLGLALVAARSCDRQRLGLPMGLHSGLVAAYYWVNVGQLLQPRSGTWLGWTGWDGNPLQSLPGLLLLLILWQGLAVWARSQSTRTSARS